jgi:hypothetical protein
LNFKVTRYPSVRAGRLSDGPRTIILTPAFHGNPCFCPGGCGSPLAVQQQKRSQRTGKETAPASKGIGATQQQAREACAGVGEAARILFQSGNRATCATCATCAGWAGTGTSKTPRAAGRGASVVPPREAAPRPPVVSRPVTPPIAPQPSGTTPPSPPRPPIETAPPAPPVPPRPSFDWEALIGVKLFS